MFSCKGCQQVKIEKNDERFVATIKTKFFYDDVMQIFSLWPPFFITLIISLQGESLKFSAFSSFCAFYTW